jgi:ribosome biogenesis GTPase A
MSIHWFPGHMATARKDIRKAMPEVDLVIEVLDARIPFSSENPLVRELRGEKPFIQILNKSDLADPLVTAEWLACIGSAPGVRALAHSQQQPHLLRSLIALGRSMVSPSRVASRPLLAMILDIPNVGKSTLINGLAGRSIAKTGNKPAVTQAQQRIKVGPDLVLLDTPGFLWPKLSPAACGYRLGVTGAISDRAVEYTDLAVFAARFLVDRYPAALARHYNLQPLPVGEEALLDAIGRRRGYLVKGGVVDMQKASERLIVDLRTGCFGPISMETPADCYERRGEG